MKIIIHYDNMTPEQAVTAVLKVINQGKISQAGGVLHYCWATIWNGIVVFTNRKKHGQNSDSFRVTWDDRR